MQDSYLPSIGKSGMTVEVGPVPQGCLTSKIYHVRQFFPIRLTLDSYTFTGSS